MPLCRYRFCGLQCIKETCNSCGRVPERQCICYGCTPGGTRTEFSDVANMTIPETMQTGLMTAEAVAQIGLRGAHRGQISVVTGLMASCDTSHFRFLDGLHDQ